MSTAIISFMFIILLAVSVAHFAWAFGFSWPIRNEKLLAQTVVGTPGVERMPPRLTSFGVAVFLAIALFIAVAMGSPESGGPLLSIAGWACALVFLARGIAGYTPWWARQFPEPNFRLNDARVYSPICLFLGAGFVALDLMRM
nr:DUF3995 domain-containing protein [uncultured Devosia sp.]